MSDETPKAETPTAPAVHGDTLWDGPRVFDAHAGEPVRIETKTDYWRYLKANGLRMKHQQESSTGPGEAPEPAPAPVVVRPEVTPLTPHEAHIFGAITAIFKRYGLVESIWCDDCAARGDLHGCRMIVSDRRVVLGCRCGVASYQPPTGTTDLRLTSLANTAVTELDHTAGSVLTPAGPSFRPTTLLHQVEADLIRRYVQILRARSKEPRWFHPPCWSGQPYAEDEALGMKVNRDEIVLVCRCRMLYYGAPSKTRH